MSSGDEKDNNFSLEEAGTGIQTIISTDPANDSVLQVGIRARVDQLSNINTNAQMYSVGMFIDLDWEATADELERFAASPTEYVPNIIPRVNFVNFVKIDVESVYQWNNGNVYQIKRGIRKFADKQYNRMRLQLFGDFTEEFEVASFPFDVQDLSIVIASTFMARKYLTFVPIHTKLEIMRVQTTWCSITDWEIIRCDAYQMTVDWAKIMLGIEGDTNNAYPYMIFRVQVRRRWRLVFYRIAIWMFLLGLLSFGIFALRAENIESRLEFAVTMVLTIVAFQFVLTSELPRVSYLTFIDKYNLFIFGIVIVQAFESILVGFHSNGFGDIEFAQEVDYFFMLIIGSFFVVGQICFVVYSRVLYLRELLKFDKEPDIQSVSAISYVRPNIKELN